MKRGFLMLPLLAVVAFLNGQIADNWTFGYHFGLNFATTPPGFIVDSIEYRRCNVQYTSASSASNSISDCNGNLLFYSNGFVVWNKYNQLMPDNCLKDSAYSGDEDELKPKFLKFINNDSLYYIFYSTGRYGLRYAIINMNADNGNGSIISNHNYINNFNANTNATTKAPELIKNANDTDYWLLCKLTDTTIFAYLITANGINLTPVISNIGGLYTRKSSIKASLSGNFIFYSDFKSNLNANSGYVCNFNRSTGEVTNQKTLFNYGNANFLGSDIAIVGSKSSPNDSFVYIVSATVNTNTYHVTQYKRYLSNPGNFPIELNYGTAMWGIRLAPDGKIYLSNFNTSTLSCITRPDEVSFGCNYVYNYLNIAPSTLYQGFPSVNFQLHRLKFATNAYNPTSCITDSVYFIVQGDTTFLDYRWYIYNNSDSIIDSMDIKNPVLWFANGTYKIKLRAKNPQCNSYTWWTDNIYVNRNPKLNANIDSIKTSCSTQFIRIKYHAVADSIQVNWNDGTNSIWLKADTVGYLTHNYYDSSYIYPIIINVKNQTCDISLTLPDSVKIQPKPIAKFFANNATKTFPIGGCTPLNINLTDSSKNADSTWYLIHSISGANYQFSIVNFQLTDTGWFNITQYATTTEGCIDSFVVNNAVYVSPKPTVQIQKDTTFNKCIEDHLRLRINNAHTDIVSVDFGDGITNFFTGSKNGTSIIYTISHPYTTPGYYLIVATGINGYCNATDTIKHLVRPPLQLVIPLNNITLCKGMSVVLSALATGGDSVFTYILKDSNTINQNATGLFLVKPNITTIYTIGAINACAKDTVWKQITVTIRPPLVMHLSTGDTTLCKGTIYTINASAIGGMGAGYSFSLYKSGILVQSDSNGVFSFLADTTADYSVVVSDGCSPNDTARFIITVRSPLKLKLNIKDTAICQPASIAFQATGIGGDTISYNFSLYKSGILIQNNHNGTFTIPVDSTSSYSVILSDVCSVNDSSKFKVTINDALKLKLSTTDTTLCKGAPFTLIASATGGNGNYVYSLFGSSSQLISTNTTGNFSINTDSDRTYTVIVTDHCSIKNDSGTIIVKVNSGTINDTVTVLYTTVLDSVTTYTIWNKLSAAVSYTIRNTTITDTFFVHHNAEPAIQSEKYYVTSKDVCGNNSVASKVAQTIYLKAENDASGNYSILTYTPYETWKQGVFNYDIEYFNIRMQEWIKLSSVSGSTLSTNAEALPDSGGFNAVTVKQCYRIVAHEQYGNEQQSISNEACVSVYPVVFLPNAFSPNGDGLNDYYKPFCAGLSIYSFEIYDRWGQLIYTDTPESKGWDGTFKGKALPVGIYVYRMSAQAILRNKYTNPAGAISKGGTIMLVR